MGKDLCLGCSKKFTKNEAAIQCTVCGLWIHKTCANMSDEVFDLLDKQKRENGITYWACTTFAQGMNHRLRQIDNDLKELKQTTSTNTEAIKKLEVKVDEVKEIAKKNDGMTREEFESRMKEEREEAKERKARELNVIIHGIDECSSSSSSGEERMQWDLQKCTELFEVMELGATAADLKFCRRVGARGGAARPVVVGLYNDRLRARILRADWKSLEPEVSVGPDLTKKQREEEAQAWKELDEKNKNRTPDELAKNLAWRMVGQKGERRIILGQAREQMGAGGRGVAFTRRGAATWRGRQRGRGAPARGRGGQLPGTEARTTRPTNLLPPPAGRGQTWRPQTGAEDSDKEEMEEGPMDNTVPRNRPRISSKSKEREVDETMLSGEEEGMREPPAKH
jgi:hypothetical protein